MIPLPPSLTFEVFHWHWRLFFQAMYQDTCHQVVSGRRVGRAHLRERMEEAALMIAERLWRSLLTPQGEGAPLALHYREGQFWATEGAVAPGIQLALPLYYDRTLTVQSNAVKAFILILKDVYPSTVDINQTLLAETALNFLGQPEHLTRLTFGQSDWSLETFHSGQRPTESLPHEPTDFTEA